MPSVDGLPATRAARRVLALKALVAKYRKPGLAILLVGSTALLVLRFLWLIDQFAVDLLFSDGWDLWDGFFRHSDAWTLWRVQHGPQRQGLAQWIMAAIAWASDWNVRAEQFAAGVVIVLATLMGLATARSLRGRWSPGDALIPAALLTVSLVSVATVSPNLAHGPMPLLLVLTCAYFAQVRRESARVLGIAFTLALSIQTGFTWLMVIVVFPLQVVLLVEAARAGRRVRHHVFGLALVVASLGVFFHGFHFEPAVACFSFPAPQPWRYVVFIAVMVQRMIESPARWMGMVGLSLGLGLALWSAWTTVVTAGRDRLAASVFVLSAFPLVFTANTAVGRLCLGYHAGTAGRYIPYSVPLVVALYLFIAVWPRLRWIRPALVLGLLALLTVKETTRVHEALTESRYYARLKLGFRSCYLERANLGICHARWPLHPAPEQARIQEKLDYLRAHRLGLFRPAASAPGARP
jgi:hypothetical protein